MKKKVKVPFIQKLVSVAYRRIEKEFDSSEKKQMYEQVASKVNQIDSRISVQNIIERLDDGGKFYLARYNKTDKAKEAGSYFPADNVLFVWNVISPRIVFHECMHKLQRQKERLLSDKFTAFKEGAVEYTTEQAYSDGSSRLQSIGNTDVQLNFSEDTKYPIEVAIVSQMNQILGQNRVVTSVLNGDFQWQEDFKNTYGKELFNQVSAILSVLHKKSDFQQEDKTLDQIKTVQYHLLTNCFDQKLQTCVTEKDYLCYLAELQQFQPFLIGIKGDKTYEYYQKTVYEQIEEKFKTKGYSMNKIKDYSYKPAEYNPLITEEKQRKQGKHHLMGIARDMVENDQEIQLKNYTRKMDRNHLGYDILQRDGKLISCCIWNGKGWSIGNNPQKQTNSDLRNQLKLTPSQTLYSVNQVYIIEEENGDVSILDTSRETNKKYENFEEIDLTISSYAVNTQLPIYLKREKADKKERERLQKKEAKKHKGKLLLPESTISHQEERKQFKESMKIEHFNQDIVFDHEKNKQIEKQSSEVEESLNGFEEEL